MDTQKTVLTVRETVARSRAEGMPVGEAALRRWIKSGEIPAVMAGSRALIYWPNFVSFVQGSSATKN